MVSRFLLMELFIFGLTSTHKNTHTHTEEWIHCGDIALSPHFVQKKMWKIAFAFYSIWNGQIYCDIFMAYYMASRLFLYSILSVETHFETGLYTIACTLSFSQLPFELATHIFALINATISNSMCFFPSIRSFQH